MVQELQKENHRFIAPSPGGWLHGSIQENSPVDPDDLSGSGPDRFMGCRKLVRKQRG